MKASNVRLLTALLLLLIPMLIITLASCTGNNGGDDTTSGGDTTTPDTTAVTNAPAETSADTTAEAPVVTTAGDTASDTTATTSEDTSEDTASETAADTSEDTAPETTVEPVETFEENVDNYANAGATSATVLHAADFGVKGDGVTDDGPAIKKALEAAAEQHATLEFEDGKHYFIDKTGASNGFDSPFNFVKTSNFTVDGKNSVFVMAPGDKYMYVNQSSDIKIINCKFDYSVSVYLVGHITAVNGKTVDYDIDMNPYLDSYDFTTANGFSIVYNEGVQGRAHMFMTTMKKTADRHVQVVYKNHNYAVGDIVFLPNPGIGHCISEMVNITDNDGGLVFENIEIRQAPGFTIAIKSNEAEIYFNDIRLTPGDENNREIKMVSWRDGFHCKDNRAPIHWDNCHVDVIFDDVFNISDTLGYITTVASDNDFCVINYENYQIQQTVPFDCRTGDVVDIYQLSTGKYCGCARVRGTVANPDGSTRVILDYNSEMSGVEAGYLVSNRSTCAPGSTIKNSYFTGTFRFLRNLRIENCTFDNLMTWIMVEGSVEGPLPGNIDYVNCTVNGGSIQIDAYDRNRNANMPDIGKQICDIGFWGCTFNDCRVKTATRAKYTRVTEYTEADLFTVKNNKPVKAVNVLPVESDFSGYMVTYDWYRNRKMHP